PRLPNYWLSLSLHDALPLSHLEHVGAGSVQGTENAVGPGKIGIARGDVGHEPRRPGALEPGERLGEAAHRSTSATLCTSLSPRPDRKSTRLNSSHVKTSYAV